MQGWRGSRSTATKVRSPHFVAVALVACALLVPGNRAEAFASPAVSPPEGGAGFGSAPSGAIPIIYNDHTVYAKPDVLKHDRVLAALVRGHTIYVPLRSMFERMGATVSVSADGKTVTAQNTGGSVSVTLGKDVVVVNGEPRPLDVAPILYNGVVLAPVRVLSEALGAYVQWLPARRVVVVRYLSSPPPVPDVTPAPTPSPAPTVVPVVAPPAPSPSPSPVPAATYRGFVQAAIAARTNDNEFSAGGDCPEAYILSGAYTFENSKFALKADYRQDVYVTSDNITDASGNHYTQFSTIDGGAAVTPVFVARQSSFDARLEYQVASPRIYVGAGYLHTANNFGYPQLNAVGAGIEKLPDLRHGLNPYGSAFYYPSATGSYTIANPASINAGKTYQQRYAILKYDVGLAFAFARSPLYVHAGFAGDRYTARQNAPIGQTHDGPYIGLGVKL